MKGFFTTEQTQSTSRPDGKTYSCASCGLYKGIETPKMKPAGAFKGGILNVGPFPELTDDRKGKPFQGEMGKLLRSEYHHLGVDLFEDCLNTNAVTCVPVGPDGRSIERPTGYEVCCCRRSLDRLIRDNHPKVIILLGAEAVRAVLGTRWKNERALNDIDLWRGFVIPDRMYNAWVCPVFDPALILKAEGRPEVLTIWRTDLERALSMVDVPFPTFKDEKKAVVVTDDVEGVLSKIVEDCLGGTQKILLALDIETSGLKPYDKGVHQIACISFCYEEGRAYCIPAPRTKREKALLRKVLTEPSIGKVAANMKFEDTWLTVMYRIGVAPWVWDTMQAAHVLDNRPGITSLKFQSFVQFGVVGYEEAITPYLKSPDSNTPNRISEVLESPTLTRELMEYCGMDSLMTYRLARMQMEMMGVRGEE